MMSITRLVVSLAKMSMEPLVPAFTMAALAATVPVGAFKLATTGFVCPVGHAVRPASVGIRATCRMPRMLPARAPFLRVGDYAGPTAKDHD